jgi:Flp pilus assembly protein TadG
VNGQAVVASRRQRRNGQALVEFALVVPILLLLMMGVVDIGRLLFTYIALEDAVQEGSIYAAHEPAPISEIEQRVLTSSNHPEVTGATVSVSCTLATTPGTITVTASYPVPMITPVVSGILGGSVAMTATFMGTNFIGSCP